MKVQLKGNMVGVGQFASPIAGVTSAAQQLSAVVNRSLIMFEDSLLNSSERIVRPRVAIQETFGAARPGASRRKAQARA